MNETKKSEKEKKPIEEPLDDPINKALGKIEVIDYMFDGLARAYPSSFGGNIHLAVVGLMIDIRNDLREAKESGR